MITRSKVFGLTSCHRRKERWSKLKLTICPFLISFKTSLILFALSFLDSYDFMSLAWIFLGGVAFLCFTCYFYEYYRNQKKKTNSKSCGNVGSK
ncbi:hypothetical protein C1645_168039 [Glomus cerebriforme]|uniref:Uncharacterized protein n=1 Tax=Glomus cerebriforme TaxID=658196 RepID=A0A397S2B3_9GLOM|nr:hypothetical protein C1645_168039 [Glomus cerebriforme]